MRRVELDPCPPPAGTVALGLLGTGSVCVVARVDRAGEQLACKRVLPHLREVPAARRALVREARALELAHHPGLPALREVGADEAGPYLLETVIEGLPLREVKARWAGRLPRRLALHLASQATALVAELHALGDDRGSLELVHGDLGPDNLWVAPHGRVDVLDLGSARFRGFGPELETGDRGTPPYAAPELARGETVSSQATDTYALAATVAWTLLDGDAPLVDPAADAAVLRLVGERGIDPGRLASLPTPIRDALAPLLAFDPGRRPRDLGPLLAALAQV